MYTALKDLKYLRKQSKYRKAGYNGHPALNNTLIYFQLIRL